MSIIQIGILGVVGALLAIQLKGNRPEYSIYIGIAVSLFIFASVLGQLELFLNGVREVEQFLTQNSTYFGTFIKMLGITYVAEFSSGICKDAGYQTIAIQIEMFGKLVILGLSIPVLLALLETIQGFLS